ncbi:MAG: universal stress protein [Deltaproteobacteria bacterium]|nr:universal stress protein [Deltaproteobacteria bacterium]
MPEIKRVLFPIDFTENSSKIFPYVLSIAGKYDATIYLVHVVEDFSKWGGFYIPHIPFEKFHEEAMQGAKMTLDSVCERQPDHCAAFQKRIVFGDPAQEIIRIIEEEKIDLVIMGTHGRKGLELVFFGSVAENVVKKSPAPVLTINPYKVK